MKRTLHKQKHWEWPIAVYLYLAGMGAGAFAVGVLVDWVIRPSLPSAGMVLWGPMLVALGAPFLVLDLGKKRRFLNACRNPGSSWAARGFFILSSLTVAGLAAFVLAVSPSVILRFGFELPNWCGDLSRVLQMMALVLSFGTAAYTGMFLKSVKNVSLWNTWLLPVLFVFSALSTGGMALIVFLVGFALVSGTASVLALTHTLVSVVAVLLLLEGGSLAWLLFSWHRGVRASTSLIRHLAARSSPSLIIGLALLAVASFGWPYSAPSLSTSYAAVLLIAGAIVLAGGFALRYDIVKVGAKNEHPLHRMAAAQYDWASLAGSTAMAFKPAAIEVPVKATPVYVPKLAEQPLFEVAFSVFRVGSRSASASRIRILAALQRSWLHPVRLEYSVVAEGA